MLKTAIIFSSSLLFSMVSLAFVLGTGVYKDKNSAAEKCLQGKSSFIASPSAGVTTDPSFMPPSHNFYESNIWGVTALVNPNDGSLEDQFVQRSEEKKDIVRYGSKSFLPAQFKLGNERLDEMSVLESAKDFFSDAAKLSNHCGEKVITQTVVGGELWLNVKYIMPNSTQEQKDVCTTQIERENLTSNWLKLTEFKAAPKQYSYLLETCSKVQVMIDVLQRGGSSDKIPTFLMQEIKKVGATTLAQYKCDLSQSADCATLTESLSKYIWGQGGFFSSVIPGVAIDKDGGPARLQYIFLSYPQVVVFPGAM